MVFISLREFTMQRMEQHTLLSVSIVPSSRMNQFLLLVSDAVTRKQWWIQRGWEEFRTLRNAMKKTLRCKNKQCCRPIRRTLDLCPFPKRRSIFQSNSSIETWSKRAKKLETFLRDLLSPYSTHGNGCEELKHIFEKIDSFLHVQTQRQEHADALLICHEQTALRRHEDCPICFQQLDGKESVALNACKHEFHHDCLRQWLISCPTCPICRQLV